MVVQLRAHDPGFAPRRPGALVNVRLQKRQDAVRGAHDAATKDDQAGVEGMDSSDCHHAPDGEAVVEDFGGDGIVRGGGFEKGLEIE